MTVLRPVQAFHNTYSAKLGATQSAFFTFSFANTGGWDAEVPVKVLGGASISAGPEVYLMRSMDGGANYESEKIPAGAFSRAASATQIKSIIIPNGHFLVAVMTGGGAVGTWSIDFAATARVITAYEAL